MATIDPFALISLDDYKEYISMPLTNADYDEQFINIINATSFQIESYLNRKILKREYTEFYNGNGKDELALRQFPFDFPTEIWVDPTRLFSDLQYQQPLTNFVKDAYEVGLLYLNSCFPIGKANIKVVYQAGLDAVPEDIKQATRVTVNQKVEDIQENRTAIASKTKGDETINYVKGLTTEVKEILEPYRFEDIFPGMRS